ncbi:hypothetical protein QQM79_11880 [Marinobacteraceae bacterium S3BR75-40.1]
MAVNALNTAVNGLQTQKTRLNGLAQEIASGGRVTPQQPAAPESQPATRDLTAPVVELKQTELMYKANAKVFETADETLGTLLDIDA